MPDGTQTTVGSGLNDPGRGGGRGRRRLHRRLPATTGDGGDARRHPDHLGSGLNAPRAWRWTSRATSSSPTPATTRSWRCCPTAPRPTIGSGLNHPVGVAVDAAGDVFIADTATTPVMEVQAQRRPSTTVGSGLKQPAAWRWTRTGDVFVADTGNNAVGGGARPTAPRPPSAPGSINPCGVAVDGRATSSSPTTATTEWWRCRGRARDGRTRHGPRRSAGRRPTAGLRPGDHLHRDGVGDRPGDAVAHRHGQFHGRHGTGTAPSTPGGGRTTSATSADRQPRPITVATAATPTTWQHSSARPTVSARRDLGQRSPAPRPFTAQATTFTSTVTAYGRDPDTPATARSASTTARRCSAPRRSRRSPATATWTTAALAVGIALDHRQLQR